MKKFISSKSLIRKHPLWRVLEIVPGTLSWFGLAFPIILSIFAPVVAASFIIIYTIVWLFRSIKLSINLSLSYFQVKNALATDWEKLINLNDHPEKIDYEIEKLRQKKLDANAKSTIELYENLKNQLQILKEKNQYKKSKEILHAIIYVTYKEPYELVLQSIKSYTQSQYPSSKMVLVFAGEESDQANVQKMSEKLKTQFGGKFMEFITTIHPKNVPGEIKGKSANSSYAAKELKKYLDNNKIPYDDVMVSNFDADTVVHPHYFSNLTYRYLTTVDRTEKGYQPTHMFHNNIWDVPIMIRMVALACTFWCMAESIRPEKYKSFSSRSLSFQTLTEVDYWDPAIIPEDSHQYWTAYMVYSGRHTLVPIYCPVYMDAVLADTYVKTFHNQYKQLQRWAWGVCDFPFVALNLWKHPYLKLSQKIYLIYDFLKNSFFWATGPILITFMGFLPGLLNAGFRDTVLAYNLPQIMSNILTLASVGIIVCAMISLTLIPYNPKRKKVGQLSLCIQWLLVPFVSIFLSAIPAFDAQTRLMFGKYLEYKVTEKARRN